MPVVSQHKRAFHEINDPQAHGLLKSSTDWRPSFVELTSGAFFLPSAYTMRQTEDISLDDVRAHLEVVVNIHGHEFDVIILDAQAGADRFAELAIEQADTVMIVSEYDPVSVKGIERLRSLFSRVLSDKEVFVLFNKLLPDLAASFSDHLVIAKYLKPLHWDADVVRAFARGEIAIDMVLGNPFTLSCVRLIEQVFDKDVAEAVTTWKEGLKTKHDEPAMERLVIIERELDDLERMRYYPMERVLKSIALGMAVVGAAVTMGAALSMTTGTELIEKVLCKVGGILAVFNVSSGFTGSRRVIVALATSADNDYGSRGWRLVSFPMGDSGEATGNSNTSPRRRSLNVKEKKIPGCYRQQSGGTRYGGKSRLRSHAAKGEAL